MKTNHIFFLLLLTILFSCSKKIETLKPELRPIVESVYASGKIKAVGQYQVYAEVSGILKEIYKKRGDSIQMGEALFAIENNQSLLQLENARLAYEYSKENSGKNSDKLSELNYQIELSKEKVLVDSTNYFRQVALWKQNIGSKIEYERSQLTYQSSIATYHANKSRYEQLKISLENDTKRAETSLQLSKNQVSMYTIYSKTEGIMYDLLKEKGEMISPQVPLGIVGSSKNFEMELQVDEKDIVRLKTGQEIAVHLDSYGERTFKAVLDRITPLMNERTRSFTVYATFTENPEILYPNLNVEANIIINQKDNVLVIPINYLSKDGFVTNENNEKIQVKTGLKNYQYVEILSGIDTTTRLLKTKTE